MKLKKQPLILVLVEFRFSQVLEIGKFIPAIQSALRKDYPTLENKATQAINFEANGIAVNQIQAWAFLSADKKNVVEINHERLVFYTTDYDRFEGFSNKCKFLLETMKAIVEPGLITRIGLRYADLIRIDEQNKLSELINPAICPVSTFNTLGKIQHERKECYIVTDAGQLVFRTLWGVTNRVLPPDLHQLSLPIGLDLEYSEKLILDFDHFWDSRKESVVFDSGFILTRLQSLHKASKEAFDCVTTDKARREIWF